MPGSDFADTKNVPHGGVAAVTYYSTALSTFRRMHVYTPPGYERNSDKYPVFYLLHGAGDSDDSWTSVGRAGLHPRQPDRRQEGEADDRRHAGRPHAPRRRSAGGAIGRTATDEFVQGLHQRRHAVRREELSRPDRSREHGDRGPVDGRQPHAAGRASRNLERFAYIGVYSSGLLGAFPGLGGDAAAPRRRPHRQQPRRARRAPRPHPLPPPQPTAADWEKENAATLDNASLKKGLKLFWFATGKDDFLLTTTNATVELFKKHGFNPV